MVVDQIDSIIILFARFQWKSPFIAHKYESLRCEFSPVAPTFILSFACWLPLWPFYDATFVLYLAVQLNSHNQIPDPNNIRTRITLCRTQLLRACHFDCVRNTAATRVVSMQHIQPGQTNKASLRRWIFRCAAAAAVGVGLHEGDIKTMRGLCMCECRVSRTAPTCA